MSMLMELRLGGSRCAVEDEEEEHYKSVIRKMIHVTDKDEEEVTNKKKTNINQEIIDEDFKIDDKITKTSGRHCSMLMGTREIGQCIQGN